VPATSSPTLSGRGHPAIGIVTYVEETYLSKIDLAPDIFIIEIVSTEARICNA
jgi:hypothetical protein